MTFIAELTDFDAAQQAFQDSMSDVAGDNPEMESDDYAADIVVSVAMRCDQETARELCRCELGYVPQEVLRYFPGMKPVSLDW